MGELRRSIAMIYAPSMLDVNIISAVLCMSLLALQPLINLKFFTYIFAVFLIELFRFFAINDALASSPQGGTAIDS